MTRFIRSIRTFSVGMVLSTLVACSPGATLPSGSGAQTGSTPAVDRTPVHSQTAQPRQETPAVAQALPQELEGLWTSVGQGSAETVYRFRTDGRYDKVSILLQQRPNGIFSFTITASGFAEIDGDRLTLTPVEGTQAMEDPDSPSSNFDKPLADLTPDQFAWAFQEGRLILTNQRGTVTYTWEPDQ